MRIALISGKDDPRLAPVADAFETAGCRVTRLVHRDSDITATAALLDYAHAALVWVDPITGGENRSALDALLRDAAARGVLVSADPDTIDAIGTKDVLYRSRHLAWGSDVYRYDDTAALRAEFPARLANGPRVLKPLRGNAGIGVWRVERVDDTRAEVHGAEVRDLQSEIVDLATFLSQFDGVVLDQPFVPRVAEGIVRCYVVVDEVVGFALQGPGELAEHPDQIMGLPSPKTMFPVDAPQYAALRDAMESRWITEMGAAVGIDRAQLPLLWDADFLLGDGDDSYVLCEINASCVTPFPPETPPRLVAATLARLQAL
ncbi:MAG: hypothetical protein QOG90_1716 [Actinomycetota bacterium]